MDIDVGTLSYEEALSRLEQIVHQLERGEGTLDAALNKFKEGMTLSQHCAARLSVAEQTIQKLVETAGRVSLEPFKTEA